MRKIIYKIRQVLLALKISYSVITFLNCIQIIRFIFKRFILKQHIPMLGIFSVTYRCQCSCVHCGVSDFINKKITKESTEEAKAVIDSFTKCGMLKVNFFGGEPLLRKDIVELVAYATQRGLRSSLATNGILLSEPLSLELKKAGIGNITVSIDSADEKTHDLLRGHKGCFVSAVNALKVCKKHRIPVSISCFASNLSIVNNDLYKIILLGENISVDAIKIRMPIFSGRCDSDNNTLSNNEREYLRGLLNHPLIYIEGELSYLIYAKKCCPALKKQLIFISPDGEVQPCPAIAVSLGNILQEVKLEKILNKPVVKQFYNKYTSIQLCLANTEQFRSLYSKARAGVLFSIKVESLVQ